MFLIHFPKTLQFQLFLERFIPMKGILSDSNQPSFLLPSLKEQLDPNHPIYQLNEKINWSLIEEDFKKLYSHTGRPAKPVRLIVSLLLLKQLEDLSDEQVIRRWVDIPYWQYLSGETHFQWKPPAASSDLTHFRKRIGKKGAERLLKLSIELFNPKIQKEEVVICSQMRFGKHYKCLQYWM